MRVKYYIGGHRALTEVSPASQTMMCRAPMSNGEACRWASHAEQGKFLGQAPVTHSLVARFRFMNYVDWAGGRGKK